VYLWRNTVAHSHNHRCFANVTTRTFLLFTYICAAGNIIYEGKSLNNRNFILKCMEMYAQWKFLFLDTKWLLSNMPYRRRDDRAVWARTIAHTVWPLHCQLATWKSNEVLFSFCGQRVWNLLKYTEEWRFSIVTVVRLSFVWTYERTFVGPQVCRWWRDNGGCAKLVKGHTKKLNFSRGHPQACGQVDQVCCEAGGTVSENKTQTISVSTLVKSYYRIPVI
jgi:hypothetical protein